MKRLSSCRHTNRIVWILLLFIRFVHNNWRLKNWYYTSSYIFIAFVTYNRKTWLKNNTKMQTQKTLLSTRKLNFNQSLLLNVHWSVGPINRARSFPQFNSKISLNFLYVQYIFQHQYSRVTYYNKYSLIMRLSVARSCIYKPGRV